MAEGHIRWRVLMSGQRLLHVQRLALSLVPHGAQLIADAEAHQGFVSAMPEGEDLQTQLLHTNPLIAPDPQVCTSESLFIACKKFSPTMVCREAH